MGLLETIGDAYGVKSERRNPLPSLWQLGDYVSATFPGTGLLKKCKVIKVAFTEHTEPLYDIEVPYQYYEGSYDPDNPDMPTSGCVRVHGLKEWHLRNPDDSIADRIKEGQKQIAYSERRMVEEVNKLCEESLPPELFEKWVEVQGMLHSTRRAFKQDGNRKADGV
jgi:hypothetical protein